LDPVNRAAIDRRQPGYRSIVYQRLIRLLELQVQISSLEQEMDVVLVQLDTPIQYLNGGFRSSLRNHRRYPCHGHNLG
jgi:hypothetical protein